MAADAEAVADGNGAAGAEDEEAQELEAQPLHEPGAREGAAREDRRRAPRLPEGARRGRGRRRQGAPPAAREGPRQGGQEGLPGRDRRAVGSYIHPGGKIGVLVEVNCETDFVAKTDEFQQLVRDLAMQVAAASPRYVRREDVPGGASSRASAPSTACRPSRAASRRRSIERIVAGQLERYYKDVCLLEQPFIKQSDRTVERRGPGGGRPAWARTSPSGASRASSSERRRSDVRRRRRLPAGGAPGA